MNIGILTTASKQSGGAYQYTLALLESLKYFGGRFNYVQITDEAFPKILSNYVVLKNQKNNLFLKVKEFLFLMFALRIAYPLRQGDSLKLKNIDMIISPAVSPLLFYLNKPEIVVIHDFQHKYYPGFFSIGERFLREIIYRIGRKAVRVVCESNFVKDDLTKFLAIENTKIRVLVSPPHLYINSPEMRISLLSSVKNKYKLSDRYLFYPANFWYHKNHIKLLKALKLLKERFGLEIQLVLSGSKNNGFKDMLQEMKRLKIENQVKYLGYVTDEDLLGLYKLSTALIMPTFFESVSMPIWEAFYLGCPVVSSNVCALRNKLVMPGCCLIQITSKRWLKVFIEFGQMKD
jgi:glycosyltransferase involved in cell wall biosynthesis